MNRKVMKPLNQHDSQKIIISAMEAFIMSQYKFLLMVYSLCIFSLIYNLGINI